jgi:hypothetical protein
MHATIFNAAGVVIGLINQIIARLIVHAKNKNNNNIIFFATHVLTI